MIKRSEIQEMVKGYAEEPKIAVIASHSALDTCDGAIEEGFRTLAICQKGREKTYSDYFRAKRNADGDVVRGIIDEVVLMDKFSGVLEPQFQAKLRRESALFVPNRSFSSYVSIDSIEKEFKVPLLGSRNMLRTEERGEAKDYYWLLQEAGLPFPRKFDKPESIDRLVIVKLHHKVKKLERGFFTAASYDEYREKSQALIRNNVITSEDLAHARIEEYIIGPVFNLDFFFSPLEYDMSPIELLGVDWRFESSLDGHVRLPAPQQMGLNDAQRTPEYTVCGHNSSTLRESLLENAFVLAEKYVRACKQHYDPGIIGPFCLQTCVDKDLKFYIYDVAPRIGGGTNVHMWVGHPYGNALWRTGTSTGRRISMEVRRALEEDRLEEIVT
ncbi:MAG: formate--phosphoribosylaminoimidazolecarboxamide ligase family protein [Euryarchaeota archaeon]|nr:formate--phosphoribosylaminoimidazolecarboxamide ligase family protein [Euryarchaeota archaeon]